MNRITMRILTAVLSVLVMSCLVPLVTAAQITIVKAGASKSTIDLSGLTSSGSGASLFHRVLENDLGHSGCLTVISGGGAAYRVTGACADAGGNLSVECHVTGSNGRDYLDKTYSEESGKARKLAHKVADEILWAVKEVKGIASTRLVMVGNVRGKKDLYMCDADGGGMVQLTRDGAPCITPRWSRDGDSLVYTSYKSGYPDVYILDINSYEWRRVANFPGLNCGGTFSPSGRDLALILSKDGNPELYTMKLRGGQLTRITQTPRIAEASPCWSPDGNEIVYVSNAARLPQLYLSDLEGGQRRINVAGSENVAPDWGAAGIVHCSRREGHYVICVYDPSSGKDVQITNDMDDSTDPSWAPDGRHVACTRTAGHHSDVYILDTQGDPPVRLTTMQGEWYCPAWSPK